MGFETERQHNHGRFQRHDSAQPRARWIESASSPVASKVTDESGRLAPSSAAASPRFRPWWAPRRSHPSPCSPSPSHLSTLRPFSCSLGQPACRAPFPRVWIPLITCDVAVSNLCCWWMGAGGRQYQPRCGDRVAPECREADETGRRCRWHAEGRHRHRRALLQGRCVEDAQWPDRSPLQEERPAQAGWAYQRQFTSLLSRLLSIVSYSMSIRPFRLDVA